MKSIVRQLVCRDCSSVYQSRSGSEQCACGSPTPPEIIALACVDLAADGISQPVPAAKFHRITSATNAFADMPRPGLGDRAAAVLAAVGITEERVARVTGRPCNCKKRREALNRIGHVIGLP